MVSWPDGACSAPRTASSTISFTRCGIALLILAHALQRILDDVGAARLSPRVDRQDGGQDQHGRDRTILRHHGMVTSPRSTPGNRRVNGPASMRLQAVNGWRLPARTANIWPLPPTGIASMTFHPSVCPHDCPSVCALEVERLPDGRLGKVRGSRAQRRSPPA